MATSYGALAAALSTFWPRLILDCFRHLVAIRYELRLVKLGNRELAHIGAGRSGDDYGLAF